MDPLKPRQNLFDMMHHDVVDFNSLQVVGENRLFRSTNHYLMLKYLLGAARNQQNIDNLSNNANDKILEDDQQLFDDKSVVSSNLDTVLAVDYHRLKMDTSRLFEQLGIGN